MINCWFCGEVIKDSAIICPWCGRRRQQLRKPFRTWKLFLGDTHAGMSMLFLLTIIGAMFFVLLRNDYSTTLFYLIVILVIALPAAVVIQWRIKRYQRIFREGPYLSASVSKNNILTDTWTERYHDASITNRVSYLVSILKIFFATPDPGDFSHNILHYSYRYNGQDYHQTLPYTPGVSIPKVARDAIFRLLRAKPPNNVTLWMLSLKPGDTIDIVLNPDDPKQAYVVDLYT